MELIEAVKEQDFDEVEVRRLLEAVSSTEYGPSRGVCMGLGQWTLDAVVARPIRPCCAESSPYVRHSSGNFDAACRRSSVPVTTPGSVTRTLPCRLAEFLAASFARNRRSRHFVKLATFDGCASGVRDGEYSKSSRSTLYR
jgi:hypothetical protein